MVIVERVLPYVGHMTKQTGHHKMLKKNLIIVVKFYTSIMYVWVQRSMRKFLIINSQL